MPPRPLSYEGWQVFAVHGNNAITIPGLPSDPTVAGGLPSTSITGFTGFGRQSTNPQWQNPALLDPKINFTWVRQALAKVRL
jgi:hypothetical protein